MSKFVKIQTELHDLKLLKQALDETRLEYQEDAVYQHTFSGFSGRLPLVVRKDHLTFGFRTRDDGAYELVADDMQLRLIRPLLGQIQQRYALHKVLQEAESAGFSLVEQNTGKDQVIRLTVRRWS
ncbi:MAG: DUF1257 domain-containing protein [Litorilinea sp.]